MRKTPVREPDRRPSELDILDAERGTLPLLEEGDFGDFVEVSRPKLGELSEFEPGKPSRNDS